MGALGAVGVAGGALVTIAIRRDGGSLEDHARMLVANTQHGRGVAHPDVLELENVLAELVRLRHEVGTCTSCGADEFGSRGWRRWHMVSCDLDKAAIDKAAIGDNGAAAEKAPPASLRPGPGASPEADKGSRCGGGGERCQPSHEPLTARKSQAEWLRSLERIAGKLAITSVPDAKDFRRLAELVGVVVALLAQERES